MRRKEMSDVFIQMEAIEPVVFFSGLFDGPFCLADDSLVPIVADGRFFGLETTATQVQTVEIMNEIFGNLWITLVCLDGLAQWVARHNHGLVAFVRNDVTFRPACNYEAAIDFQHLGEQVMGHELPEGERNEPYITFLGKYYKYTGWPRPVRSTLTTRIISMDELPGDDLLEKMREEINNKAPSDPNTCLQWNMVILITRMVDGSAKIEFCRFGPKDNFNPDKMQYLGDLQVNEAEKTMTFYPEGKRNEPIDFSEGFWN